MKTATFFVLPAIAAAASTLRRDLASITTALGYVSSNVTHVDNLVNALGNDDTFGALAIQTASGDLTDAVNGAAQAVQFTFFTLSESDAATLAQTVVKLEPQVFGLLDDLVAKAPEFKNAVFGGDASPLVVSSLQKSQMSTDTFAKNLASKFPDNYQQAAQTVISQFDAHYLAAIQAFQNN